MKPRFLIFFMLTMLSCCIGVDYLEDPVIGERIEVSPLNVALKPGQTTQLIASYFDAYGIEAAVHVAWTTSANHIATVDENGIVTAKEAGQAVITASYQNAVSEAINVNVVLDEDAVASVQLTSSKTVLNVSEKVSLTALVKNINGDNLSGRVVQWFSENSSIATVNDVGEVTAIANGIVGVHAKSENVKSNSIEFVVGSSRSGTFVPAGGYKAEGMAALRLINNELVLELSDHFKTSFALGTFVYLSNSTSGSVTFSNGLEIAQITTDGAKSFNVSAINPDVGLFDYRYVIILCKPARVSFGYADMN